MLYIRDDKYLQSKQYIEVVDEGNQVLTLRLYGVEKEDSILLDEKSVDLNEFFKPYNYFALFSTVNYSGQVVFSEIVDFNNINRSREEIYIQNYYTTSQKKPLIVIYYNASVDENVVIVNTAVKTAMENSIVQDTPADQLAVTQYPNLQQKTNIWQYRKEMMNELDPNNSLAYIEVQLDVITRALFLMLDQLPDVKTKLADEFAELKEFELWLSDTSVFTVKNLADCLAEISQTKAKVRSLQAGYFNVKKQNAV